MFFLSFQSTHSRGVRPIFAGHCPAHGRFQSTHSRGVRPAAVVLVLLICCFNPRTHEECDSLLRLVQQSISVSIHALTRSATRCSMPTSIRSSFNPRTHEECDRHEGISKQADGCFNPRTHEECDCTILFSWRLTACFNPRTHEECDSRSQIYFPSAGMFQSTHSRGVRRCIS